jgi:menaquinol-cytochrome c reductase iron-sulfur subunit
MRTPSRKRRLAAVGYALKAGAFDWALHDLSHEVVMNKHDQDYDAPEMRRGFFYKLLTVICGAVVGVFPMLAGLAVFFDPVKQKRGAAAAAAGDFLRVASLDSLPADGVPRQFPVVADQQDAWTFFPKQRVGSVFLRRTAADQPEQ